jgi:glycosyltransferase involved in cell wall biosynthesis
VEPGVSVIICCYNSASRLPETLKYLALQSVSPCIPWEILIINNASQDETTEIANQTWRDINFAHVGFRVFEELTPGKNYAFKKGVKEAKYEYILTCDDDNWLYPNYIENAYQIMQSDAKLGALGGCGIFEPQTPVNEEIKEYTEYYVNGSQTWTKVERWVYGAGSVYRKSILDNLIKIGWQQITSGRKGKSLICGEDVEICFMIYLCGYKIIADDRLLFKHFVPVERQKISYIAKLSFWLSYSHVLLNSYFTILNNDKRPIKQIMDKWLLSAAKAAMKLTALLFYQKFKMRKNTGAKKRISLNSNYGTFYSLILNRRKIINHHEHIKKLLSDAASMEKAVE